MWLFIVIFVNLYLTIINGFNQIDVTRSNSLLYNGQKINETNLHEFLENHEKILLFGNDNHKQPQPYKLVNVIHKTRKKRSIEKIINFSIGNSQDDRIQLKLKKSQKLLDDSFVFIIRYENSSKFYDNSDLLVNNFTNCFYRNENSALDICDGNIRGIFQHNSTDLVIHPLPSRFGENSHVIYKSSLSPNNKNKSFEPAIDEFNATFNNTSILLNTTKVNFNEYNLDRTKRFITKDIIPDILYIETAIFVDKDLYRHMAKNYPKNTETNLIRFVLAMINGVQLLYHHPSLGRQINFVLKRLEILHSDPKELRRSSDIDVFLNSFCLWQKKLNPVSDNDIVHFDHAVILTGLDLYVVSKNGKISSQVVGLAPVAGMCTPTSSCTINEGKHFESVFVVAHEIGHNLGMRHDTSENSCDPSLYIMSPTLGSGKITWSKCSRDYLNTFLRLPQARCMFDNGHYGASLDHSAEGILPGERFDADQQCMLKYGKDSIRSRSQHLSDICRDLHCQRDRYTWTSHPALEGTSCGDTMWCKSGVCVLKGTFLESYSMSHQVTSGSKNVDKNNLINEKKYGSLKQEYSLTKLHLWSEWSTPTECDSGCLYGETGRLREGSTGLKIYSRHCIDYRTSRKKCHGMDKKYEACLSKQCYNIPRTTVQEFANQICQRAKEFDSDINETGIQQVGGTPDESCKVFCETKSGMPKTKGWTFPDGTTCRNQNSDFDDTFYCVNGRCERFSCQNTTSNHHKMDAMFCPENLILEADAQSTDVTSNGINQENGRDYKSLNTPLTEPTTTQNIETESSRRNLDTSSSFAKSKIYDEWKMRNVNQNRNDQAINNQENKKQEIENIWIVKSGCHFSCIEMSKGIQVVNSRLDGSTNIQLCSPEKIACDEIQNAMSYSTDLCSKYKLKVRGLSGNGMQIAPSIEDPDRSCKVACQDEFIEHRFYLVNGEQGYFPFGTKCSKNENRYCVNGKCLEFGQDNIPLNESHISLALFRTKRDIFHRRYRRHFIYYSPVNITEIINRQLLDNIVANFNYTYNYDHSINEENIDLKNPIHISFEDY